LIDKPIPLPTLIDVEVLARHLGVTTRHVRRLVDERRVPFHKVGRLVRFDPVEIADWLRGNRPTSQADVAASLSRSPVRSAPPGSDPASSALKMTSRKASPARRRPPPVAREASEGVLPMSIPSAPPDRREQ